MKQEENMNETTNSSNYSKLGKTKRRRSNMYSSDGPNWPPPSDAFAIYLCFILDGVGFLLPYNSFIMAMDYFGTRYPETSVVFEMSLLYVFMAFLTVLGNNLLVETFSLNARINFGYLVSFLTLTYVTTCELHWKLFGSATSYTVDLIAIAIVAVGCTVQQSSFYGYSSMLPPKYTQALMVGESLSGVFTATMRLLTKYKIPEDTRASTFVFFSSSIITVLFCFALYHLVRRSDFIQYYMALCERAKTRITLEPTEDAGLIETNDAHYGVLKLQNSPPTGTTLSFANPVYEPSAPVPTYKVEDVVIRGRISSTAGTGNINTSSIRRGIQSRWDITKAIYPYMISISLAYFTTLCMYPGIVSEIVSCSLGSWMPLILLAIFNGADLLGKIIASSSSYWTSKRLLQCCIVRLVLIPLILLCTVPRTHPAFSHEMFPFIFIFVLGVTNGILGSVPIIEAPCKVEDHNRELTGNMMTLSYNFGLTAGSLMAYFLESVLDPFVNHPCGTIPIELRLSPVYRTFSNTTAPFVTSIPATTVLTLLSTAIDVTRNASISDIG